MKPEREGSTLVQDSTTTDRTTSTGAASVGVRPLASPATNVAGSLLSGLFVLISLTGRFGSFLLPRLGRLKQYAPRPLRISPPSPPTVDLASLATISVVTPTYQQGEFLERTILSVLDEGYPRLEYVVQDGGSKDGTKEILDRYRDRLHGCVSAPDRGQSHAINLGFSRTGGEIMAWLNSDDLYLPGLLHSVGAIFAANPSLDVVYGHRILIDENDREIGRWILPPHDHEVLSWADFIPQETMFWRRRIWERAGGYVDESFDFAMDWELLLRFRSVGAHMVRLPLYMAAFRVHAHQKTSVAMDLAGSDETKRIHDRLHGRAVTRAEITKAVAPYLFRHLMHHARRRMADRKA